MEEEKKTSKFSSGINILQRVDLLWKNCANFKRQGLYSHWNEELDTIWLELARDLDEKEYYDLGEEDKIIRNSENTDIKIKTRGLKSLYELFEKELKEIMPFQDSGTMGFKKPSQEDKNRRNKQYKLLMEKQLFLARLENKLGKGTSWEEEDDDF